MRIEAVLGRAEERADDLVRFWTAHGALGAAAARARVREVVCLVLDGDEIVGASSAVDARVPLVGHRRLWNYRRFLAPGVPPAVEPALINASFDALDAQRRRTGDGPSGLCVLVTDRALIERLPEAVWPATKLLYAGYLADGTQVRLRWFEEASILS